MKLLLIRLRYLFFVVLDYDIFFLSMIYYVYEILLMSLLFGLVMCFLD